MITNISDIQDLVDKGFIRLKDEGEYVVAKYHNKIFYDNLWHLDERLLEARGHVFRKDTGEIVVRPFDKVFNYGECGKALTMAQQYLWSRKVNGFMGAVTINKGVIVSTTGTLSSDYVGYIKQKVDTETLWMFHCSNGDVLRPTTYLFEICHEDDPHIIEEECGAYLLAARDVETGGYWSEKNLDVVASAISCHRPEYGVCSGESLKREQDTCQHEGFMVKDIYSGEPVLKIKSNTYLMQKFLARGGFKKMEKLWYANKKTKFATWEEEWLDILDKVRDTYSLDQWVALEEQERLRIIKELL